MNELWRLSATEIAHLVRTRKVSAREVTDAALKRLDDVNPRINAIVDFRPDEVREQADNIDRQLASGNDPGPLGGVPITVKINIDQAGFATSDGSRLQERRIAKSNSPVVDNLVRAGAVVLGRTNSPTFALRWFTSNLLYGGTHTRNPRNPTRTPGGSTGGGAAALTAGIGHIALGTDIGGSVRYPAYACGVHGLRPSLGRVPFHNASLPERTIGAQVMHVTGPLARTVKDIRLSLTAMSVPDPRDPWSVPAPLEGPSVSLVAAFCARPAGRPVAPEVEAAVRDAGRRLSEAGWTVEEIDDTPPLNESAEAQEWLWLADGFANLAAAAEEDGDPGALAVVAAARPRIKTYPADAIARALVHRDTVMRQWQLFFQKFAVLLIPVSAELPFPDLLDLQSSEAFARVWDSQFLLRATPVLGLPALTVSTGLVGDASVGVQILAARYREDLCLNAGEAIEAQGTPPSPIDPVS
ncbi:MAG TPA: amidase family protein [Pyrinomonadaceae bacterium]|jgi:amidase|nr:amidase family protein [Pyrinomonadaceae bacterium]